MILVTAFATQEQAEAHAVALSERPRGLTYGVLYDEWKEPLGYRVFYWPAGGPMNPPLFCSLVFTAGDCDAGAREPGEQLTLDWGAA